jgi:hypothetical protein|tara:strand:- start:2687 stop:3259 length:573 start_codon:yes stop_codon:yes gene_type:complete
MPTQNTNYFNRDDNFDYSNTFKSLTFQDYLDVIPKQLTIGYKQKQGAYWFRCFNPEHHDGDPSLCVQQGNTQACIWKCFGSMQCPQHIFTNMFNTWLIQAGKVDINKVPTKTLEGLAYQGVIKKEDYHAIKDRRKSRAMSRYQTILDSRNFSSQHLHQLEADGSHHQQVQQRLKRPSSFLKFQRERGFYG